MGQDINGCTSFRNLMEYIDGQHVRPPVLAILLETIERENFDRSFKSANISPVKNCTIS